MCDYFLQRMEGDQAGGDLTDIVRASGSMPGSGDLPSTAVEWQLPAEPMLFPPPPSSSDGCGAGGTGADVFGDPFAGLADPFSSDYSLGADFLDAMPDAMAKVGFDTAVGGGSDCGGGGGGRGGQLLDMGRKPLLPRGMQMPAVGGLAPRLMPSPLSPRAIRPYPAMAGDMVKLGITAGQAAECTIETAVAGIQMSSPRAGGIKRRKNQERKVVCIPAPTAAGGRPSAGEVVPSDLWAWRKYGQKPIKGSPYPRGYYRCSSSKGCSARKQVERCRTDPKMLVITYTSEHNHPWPTQRNALAGSTRSHHGKNNSSSSGSKSSQNEKPQQPNVKEEPKDQVTTTTTTTSTITTCTSPVVVKEESLVGSSEALERVMDTSGVVDHSELMDHVFSHFNESYKPMIPDAGQPDDFFADLAELESDPMSLIFSREYMEAKPSGGDHAQEKGMAKDLDPFDMLDWSTTTSAGSSFEQGKRD